ncbi:MAG: hypothetical protein ACI90V_013682 [Bacillariaceae sp.]|jgi:hypothetical protein
MYRHQIRSNIFFTSRCRVQRQKEGLDGGQTGADFKNYIFVMVIGDRVPITIYLSSIIIIIIIISDGMDLIVQYHCSRKCEWKSEKDLKRDERERIIEE